MKLSPASTIKPGETLTIEVAFESTQPAKYVSLWFEDPHTGNRFGTDSTGGGFSVPYNTSRFSVTFPEGRPAGSYNFVRMNVTLTYGGFVAYDRYGNLVETSYHLDDPPRRSAELGALDFTFDNPGNVLTENPNTRLPQITGTPSLNGTVTVDPGEWTSPPSTLTYQWLLNGSPLPRATDPFYFIGDGVVDHQLAVRVTAAADGRINSTAVSPPVTPSSPVNATRPVFTGKMTVGETLRGTFSEESITGAPPGTTPQIDYAWTQGIPFAFGGPLVDKQLSATDRGWPIGFNATARSGAEILRTWTAYSRTVVRDRDHTVGFDAGGSMDLLARASNGDLLLYPVDGTGRWLNQRKIGVGWNGFNSIFPAGDFDGDGSNDVIARDTAGALFLYPGDGSGGWLPRRQIGTGWGIFESVLSSGDFSGDGINDVVARKYSGQLVIFPGDGRGGFRAPAVIGHGWAVMDAVFSPGDFDGDGNPDILARDRSGFLHFYGGNGLGGWTTSRTIGQGWGIMTRVGGAGDFDGDGADDVWGIDTSGQLRMYYGNGTGGWKGSAVVGWGWGGFSAVS